mmetsp:Transcript_18338/g.25864  ORF Transcript_18338/g.25864 Transcript_18338/m.25864 type:complete len:218 (+) Transcript_18338:84-737(+)
MRVLFGILYVASMAHSFAPQQGMMTTAVNHQVPTTFLSMNSNENVDAVASATGEIDRRVALVRGAAIASGLVANAGSASAGLEKLVSLEYAVTKLERSNLDTKNSNGAPEKHIPLMSVAPNGKSLTVEVPHVMDPEKPHFIEYVWIQDITNTKRGSSKSILAVKSFTAKDASPPTLTVGVASGKLATLTAPVTKGMLVKPLCYCNLHGLWEGEPIQF